MPAARQPAFITGQPQTRLNLDLLRQAADVLGNLVWLHGAYKSAIFSVPEDSFVSGLAAWPVVSSMVQTLGWRPTAVLDKRTTDGQKVAFDCVVMDGPRINHEDGQTMTSVNSGYPDCSCAKLWRPTPHDLILPLVPADTPMESGRGGIARLG
jgi:hypothetical protein